MQKHAQLIVIGAGIAGAACALDAAAAGLSVIAVDAAPVFGGTARRGGGGVCIPGSSLQRALGIVDDPAKAFADLAAGDNPIDTDWAMRYLEQAETTVFDWMCAAGVRFEGLRWIEGDSVPRWHAPAGAGAGVMSALWEHITARGFGDRWHFGLRCTDLIHDAGRVRGVVLRDAEGAIRRLDADAVVLATGGFAGHLAGVRAAGSALAALPHALAAGGPDARGDGHRLARQAGGVLDHLDRVYAYATAVPDYRDPAGSRAVIARGVPDWIWLNRAGQRFHDESFAISGKTAVPHLLAQPGAVSWAVLDARMVDDLAVADHYVEPGSETVREAGRRLLRHSPHVTRDDDLATLLRRCGIAPAGAATIADWNLLLASGAERDPLTGRALAGLRPLAQAPFTAIRFTPASRKTLGGVQTDGLCRVLARDGGVVEGLYAVGELAGLAGGGIAGLRPLEGMMVGASLFSGRIAARTIMENC